MDELDIRLLLPTTTHSLLSDPMLAISAAILLICSLQVSASMKLARKLASASPPAPLQLGWIYQFQYVGTDCSSKPVEVEADVTSYCQVMTNSTDYPSSLMEYCKEDENGGNCSPPCKLLCASHLVATELSMFRRYFESVDCNPATAKEDIYPISPDCEPYTGRDGLMQQYHCTINSTLDLGDSYYLERM